MAKVCPFRFGTKEGKSVNCVREICALWNNGECAIFTIAKEVEKKDK